MTPHFKFGLEHEIGLVKDQQWLDFSTLNSDQLTKLIDELPVYESDYPGLRQGNVGIKVKRWYIEGLERFDEEGKFLTITPKGIEIRTPICGSIDEAVTTCWHDRSLLAKRLQTRGMQVAETGFNPFATSFTPQPALNAFETADTEMTQSETAGTYMLTYGPDINVSNPQFDAAANLDVAKKLIAYSPYLVPFSFSSPFYNGKLWGGYSVRTWYRSATRPAALAYVATADHNRFKSAASHEARIPAEIGRIEYKAFDTVGDPVLYRGLMALIKGLIMDTTLPDRADTADVRLHRQAAKQAWADSSIAAGSQQVLKAARLALAGDPDSNYLQILVEQFARGCTPAHQLVSRYNELDHNIIATLKEFSHDTSI